MPTEREIEAVAAVLYNHDRSVSSLPPWKQARKFEKEGFYARARAALEAAEKVRDDQGANPDD